MQRWSTKDVWLRVVMLIVVGVFFLIAAVLSVVRQNPAGVTLALLPMGCIPVAGAFLILRWRRRRYGDGPTTDEREQWIRLRGESAGATSFMVYWGLICIVASLALTTQGERTITIMQGEKTITIAPVSIFMVFVCGLLLQKVVQTIAIHYIRKQELTNDHE